MSDNTAILAGFTKEVLLHHDHGEMHVFVRPEVDFDDRFKAYDADECEWVMINGWLIGEIEEVD